MNKEGRKTGKRLAATFPEFLPSLFETLRQRIMAATQEQWRVATVARKQCDAAIEVNRIRSARAKRTLVLRTVVASNQCYPDKNGVAATPLHSLFSKVSLGRGLL